MNHVSLWIRGAALAAVALGLCSGAGAQPAVAAPPAAAAPAAPTKSDKVVISGTVPDEATRRAIVSRVRELYGPDLVVDQLAVGPTAAPQNWAQQVQKLLTPELKQVSRGQVSITGSVVEIKGEVPSDAQRQQIKTQMDATLANTSYELRNTLRVASAATGGQAQLDAALADRVIEFQPGSATLTPAGQAVLDKLLPIIRSLPGKRFQIIGHTDSQGAPAANVALSRARAESVRAYLGMQGLPQTLFDPSGKGPAQPVASNDTADGRARNRRIEFRAI